MAQVAVEGDARPHDWSSEQTGPKEPLPKRVQALARRHRWLIPAAILAAIVAAVVLFVVLPYLASFEDTDDAQVDGNASAIASRIAGTVLAVRVQDNDHVKQGDELVDLDPADYQVALQQAQANVDEARAQRLGQAQANAHIAQVDLGRSRRLVGSGSVAREDLDTHQATAQARAAEVTASRAAIEGAQAALEQAQLNLGYTGIRAPVSGIVAQKQVNLGDRVQPAQELLAIVQVDDVWITANFKESQLRQLLPGQRAEVHVDALDQTFRGHVESLPGATGTRFSLLPPENATGNYVKVVQRLPVRIRLEPGQANMDRLRPGMSVEPKVWLR
jgi:membrane fusion protein (multidrug efflux system)